MGVDQRKISEWDIFNNQHSALDILHLGVFIQHLALDAGYEKRIPASFSSKAWPMGNW